MNNKTVQQH